MGAGKEQEALRVRGPAPGNSPSIVRGLGVGLDSVSWHGPKYTRANDSPT